MASYKISRILQAKEPEFSHTIQDLEQLSGHNSHDIRVLSGNVRRFNNLARKLGLDENDSTLKELYFALKNQANKDADNLAKILKIKKSDTPKQAIKKCVEHLESRIGKREFWCLKQSVAKNQLKANPPKKVMKILGLRSVDSILKREPIPQIYIFAGMLESSKWINTHIEQAKQLTNNDFNNKKIKFIFIAEAKLARLRKNHVGLNQIIYSHQEFSEIYIAPPKGRFDGDVLFYFDTLINHANALIARSTFYRYFGLKINFFDIVAKMRKYGFKNTSLLNWPFRWPAILHAINYHDNEKILDWLYPDAQKEDFATLSVADTDDSLSHWGGTAVTSDSDGQILSANLSDVAVNSINNTPFESAYNEFGTSGLHDELYARYFAHDNVLDKFFNMDDVDLIDHDFNG